MAERETHLTIAQLCARWQVDRRTLRKLLGPRLPVIQISARVWRIPLSAIERYEREQHYGTS